MKYQCLASSITIVLTLTLLFCGRLVTTQTNTQPQSAKRESQPRAGNIRYDVLQAIALQPDGKIIAAGRTCKENAIRAGISAKDLDCNFALARYSADGTPDMTFGQQGKVVTDFAGNHDWVSAMALQSDGKILLAGTTEWDACDSDFALVRYNTDGTLDEFFGQQGKVVTDFLHSERTTRSCFWQARKDDLSV